MDIEQRLGIAEQSELLVRLIPSTINLFLLRQGSSPDGRD